LMEEEDGEKELTALQREIDAQLEKDCKRKKNNGVGALPVAENDEVAEAEDEEASRFAAQDTLSLIGEITRDGQPNNAAATSDNRRLEQGLAKPLISATISYVLDVETSEHHRAVFSIVII
ncbi:jg1245, partial [Pararge aegeria aegeria]